uniref:PDZ domain-containing protein n=1 Tax=Coccolithus braarudii TaxID=221442 RepID=A0A7S0L6C3_9EUKA
MGGVNGPLVDSDGFPRSDIDVHATRTLRHRLVCLNNDHKQLMGNIERGMWAVHAAARSDGGGAISTSAAPPPPSAAAPMTTNHVHTNRLAPAPHVASNGGSDMMMPFARVDAVSANGPAASAGLAVGDKIVRFGGVHMGNHDQLRALARSTQRNEGLPIPLLILRVQEGNSPLELTLTPLRWEGPGLLGCHLMPIGSTN